ncbi:hypothetical protein M405DRAFT_938446, partial [Rhizopogon salebrosus TDB-379]
MLMIAALRSLSSPLLNDRPRFLIPDPFADPGSSNSNHYDSFHSNWSQGPPMSRDAYMHQIQALHLHQTRDLVSGTIKFRRKEDVTVEHEERHRPLCALVDVVGANQYKRFFCRIQDVLGPTELRTKTEIRCGVRNRLRGYGHTTILRTSRSSLAGVSTRDCGSSERGGTFFVSVSHCFHMYLLS